MAQFALKDKILQQSLAAAGIYPTGDLIFVSSADGNDGNDGTSIRHAVATLTRAIAQAQAGDLIVLEPGGSETVTASIAVTQAGLKIFCPAANAESGFEVNGATALDLMTVSAANVHIEGLNFTRDVEAGTATAQLLTTAAADQLRVKNCVFDNSQFSSSWIGYGIELTDDLLNPQITDCKFIDCHRGILFTIASGKTQTGFLIEDNEFICARATAFGIHNNPTSTGVSQLGIIRTNLFREMLGTGAAAATWDGSNDADATVGPMFLGALCDQFLSQHNVADEVRAQAFDTLNNIGGTGKKIDNMTTVVSDDSAAVTSVGLATSTDAVSVGVLASTDVLSAQVALSTDTDSVGTLVTALGTGPFATSTALAANLVQNSTDAVSVGSLISTVGTASAATSAALAVQVVATSTDIASVGVLASTDVLSAQVALSTDLVSVGVLTSTDVISNGVRASTDTKSIELVLSADVKSTELIVSADVKSVELILSNDAKSVELILSNDVDSVGTLTSTDVLSSQVALSTDNVSVGTLAADGATGIGTPLTATKIFADTSWANNTSTSALWTATGDVMIEEIIFEKDGANMTGPANCTLRTDNTYGPTGNGTNVMSSQLSGFNANLKLLATSGSATPMVVPFLLENGAIIYAAGDNAQGAGGNCQVTVKAKRVTAGASIA